MTRGKAVGEEVRKIIVSLARSGKSASEIGNVVNLSRYTVRNIIRLYKTTNSVVQKRKTGRKPTITDINKRALRRILVQNRRSNYGELSILWNTATGKQFSRTTCHRVATELGFKVYKVGLEGHLYR